MMGTMVFTIFVEYMVYQSHIYYAKINYHMND